MKIEIYKGDHSLDIYQVSCYAKQDSLYHYLSDDNTKLKDKTLQ